MGGAVVPPSGLADWLIGVEFDTAPLHALVADSRYRHLSPGGRPRSHDARWHVVVNAEIEHDL